MAREPNSSRVYLVTRDDGGKMLVRAVSKAQAIGYATRKLVTADVAKQDDIIELISRAQTIHNAIEEEENAAE